jgi:hypothetical protein
LVVNARGATDWFVQYSDRMQETYGPGWWVGPRYTRRGVRTLGVLVLFLGAMFINAGASGS